MLEVYLLTLMATAFMQAVPGPNFLAVTGAAMGQGRYAAFFVTLGVATGVIVWVTAVAMGLGALLQLYPDLLIALKLFGAFYLLSLAVRGLLSTLRDDDRAPVSQERKFSMSSHWRHGLFVVLTNPKAVLMWIAMSTFILSHDGNFWHVLGFAPVGAASAVIVYGVYGWLFSTVRVAGAYRRFTRPFQVVMSGWFGLLGGRLFVESVQELRT